MSAPPPWPAAPYRHPELGFTLTVPAGCALTEPVVGVAMGFYDTGCEPPEDFVTNLVVTAEAVEPGAALAAHVDAALAAQDERLHGHLLIDRAPETLAGRPAERTVAHHEAGVWPVTLLQWHLLAGPVAYTVTASAATMDLPAVIEVLTEAAESFAP